MPRKNIGLTAEGNVKPKKPSNSVNGDFDLEKLRKRDKGKRALRIDQRTIIIVKPKNCNEEYAAKYREHLAKLI